MIIRNGKKEHYNKDGVRCFTRRVYEDEPPHDGEHQNIQLKIGDRTISIATRDEHDGWEGTSLWVWDEAGNNLLSLYIASAVDIARACAEALALVDESLPVIEEPIGCNAPMGFRDGRFIRCNVPAVCQTEDGQAKCAEHAPDGLPIDGS